MKQLLRYTFDHHPIHCSEGRLPPIARFNDQVEYLKFLAADSSKPADLLDLPIK